MVNHRFALTMLIFGGSLLPLSAQTAEKSPSQTGTASAPSVTSAPSPTRGQEEKPPLSGANSFTEGQALERIQKAGFAEIKDLKQDEKGVWRANAQKSGQPVRVALDFRGNVVQQ